MVERKLGRGLDGLLRGLARQDAVPDAVVAGPTTSIPLDLLEPNPQQPRQVMDPAELEHLKASIREHGVLQPILVRPMGERYQIVAGERRFRASQAIGLTEVPVVIRDIPDDQLLEVALIENLQRSDLDPIEKARSFKSYLENTHFTQEQASQRLGLDRSTLANMVRLLDLPDDVQVLVRGGQLAMGHARALLAVVDPKRQLAIAARVVREGLSVRQVEALAGPSQPRAKAAAKRTEKGAHIRDLESRLRAALGTKVTVAEGRKAGAGRIVIEFFSHEDAERILAQML